MIIAVGKAVDLSVTTVEGFEYIGLGQFGVNANNPFLIDSPDEIIFLSKDLSKATKDNEILMTNVKK